MLRQYYFLLLFSSVIGYRTYDAQYTIDLHRLKCESMAHRTLFLKNKCHILLSDASDDVYERYKEIATTNVTQQLREHRIIAKTEQLELVRGIYKLESSSDDDFRLITIEYPGFCYPGAEIIGDRCFLWNSRISTQKEARAQCAEMNMVLLKPHSNRDIQIMIDLVQSSGAKEVLLGATWSSTDGWKSNDQFGMDFFRWQGTEFDYLYNAAKQLATKLHLQRYHNILAAPMGYISVEYTNATLLFVCVSYVSSTEIFAKPTTTTSTTTTTTTTTSTTTTTTKLVCDEWSQWLPKFNLSYKKCGECHRQTRTRRILSGCPRVETSQVRNCLGSPCYFPYDTCDQPCVAGVSLINGRQLFGCSQYSLATPLDLSWKGCMNDL